ncbi:MAG: MoxR family ATPase [Alphaproteobacteria bacterium]|nr:MoxR family ATPase [Alphaproteobacteria bacterium]
MGNRQAGCQSPAAFADPPHNFVNRHALVPASILGFPQPNSPDDRSALVAPDTSTATDADAQAALADIERLGGQLRAARAAIGQVIYGQQDVIDQTLVALLSGGHLLLIGVPGLAKTKLVDTLGVVLGMDAKRIQFTPDLMPADILGSEVLEESDAGRRSFRFLQGPVFAQLLMADEINRASPRTQSALLQSMQEKHVTVAGKRYDLPAPFHVLATQNPLEQEGTYPLPEAQLDRFLLQVDVGYPDEAAERQIMIGTTGAVQPTAVQALTPADLMAAQALVRRLPIGESVVDAILKLVRAGRPEHTDLDIVRQRVAWGPGPRASQAFMLACRARAIIQGRLAPSVDDVVALAGPILRHRMAVNFSARAEGVTMESVIAQMCARLA